MNLHAFSDSPFLIQFSFHQIIEELEKQAAEPAGEYAEQARQLLQDLGPYPQFREGITEYAQVEGHEDLLRRLLKDYFPPALTLNEIKAVTFPYFNITFNHTERFKNILKAAGPDFQINIRDLDPHQLYVLSCCIILNEYYGTNVDFSTPLFYDIPAANGTIRHYRILYNADFLDVLPTEKSVPLTKEDIDLLLNNYDDLDLWKQKFPVGSWLLKGFGIMNLYDATIENAVSILKEKLLGLNAADFQESVEAIFRSIYRIPDIKIGFTLYNQEEGRFSHDVFGQQIHSYLLQAQRNSEPDEMLCLHSYYNLIQKKVYYAVSDTSAQGNADTDSLLVRNLAAIGARSFILAPIVKNGQLLGVLEVLASKPGELNSVNANKLDVVMPFLTDTIERLIAELENEVQAVIQTEYTAIHNSVYWKFRDEAQKLILRRQLGREYKLKEIIFQDVYPLYGQIDIKGSTQARNESVQKDLRYQVKTMLALLEKLPADNSSYAGERQQLKDYLVELTFPLRASTEQYISSYLHSIHRRIRAVPDAEQHPLINSYFAETDKLTGAFHTYRRMHETTVSLINDHMASIIDNGQIAMQAVYPHYYERFKTDGVEHNLYIGASIAPNHTFKIEYLHKLRLWQLQMLCEMSSSHRELLQPTLPYPLEITALVLVYNSKLAIRFRMDEKRFDVDGSYNARFEIVKKRIDKAHIQDTEERITESGKLTIVYSSDAEEAEYTGYIQELQARGMLDSDIEKLEVEDLQGVSGLKALRIKIS
ncbi:GAF domain-containing protein [Chitinophaga tropicalis]|uniref:GAF domain-containing protein n=1 Tax=Chitinophaga tropicalis TaxID=2683588 RepID=A0A7K1U895_9BACT|nr:GAF domain-containing protein [Chitinophaga tropicalis]MVT10225.1 GAF domain-containing protein [Chitinophaga tropicalis]